VISQKRKKKRKHEITTCQTKEKPGPVNRIKTVQTQRMTKAKIWRVRLLKTGSGSIADRRRLSF
jgi:hypothetical protein